MESVVHIRISRSEISACKIKPNGDTLTLDRGTIHYLEFVEVLSLCDCILSTTHDLFSYYTQFHILYLDSNQVEIDLAKDAILQVVFVLAEFEFNVQALLDTYLHFNWFQVLWLLTNVRYQEFLFLCDAIVISIYHHVNVVPQFNDNSIVALIHFLNSIELEIISDIICECSRWLQIPDQLQKCRILVFIIQVLEDTYQLNSNSQMVNSLVFVKHDGHLTMHIFSVLY